MTPLVVADAGPLIALARIERLDLLWRLYGSVVIPPAVHSELEIDTGRPGTRELRTALAHDWLTIETPTSTSKVAELALILDPGESEAIVLAKEITARFLLIDDKKGRRVAREHGLKIMGVGGLLLSAKSHGEIPAVQAELRKRRRACPLDFGAKTSAHERTLAHMEETSHCTSAAPFEALVRKPCVR